MLMITCPAIQHRSHCGRRFLTSSCILVRLDGPMLRRVGVAFLGSPGQEAAEAFFSVGRIKDI
jgi:hypothetical protein